FLNYPGGKYRLLPQLLPLFPDKVDRFVDLFAGSAVVSTNYSNTDSYLINDNNIELINLIKYVSQSNIDDFLFKTKQIIEAYGLSDTSSKGYYFYGLNSNEGLSQYNKQGYLKLRTDFNSGLSEFSRENQLYVLTVYAF
ncbi:DNA adenine methylase, partial [Oenococcus oeni]